MKKVNSIYQILFFISCFFGYSQNAFSQWELPKDYATSLDAAVYSEGQQSIIFFNDYTLKYYSLAEETEYDPTPLNTIPRFPDNWESLTAATSWEGSSLLLFNNSEYLVYDVLSASVVGNGVWEGLPATWNNQLNAVVQWETGSYLFFLGGEYVIFNAADQTYSEPDLLVNWEGWPSDWATGFSSAVNINNGYIYFFKDNQYITYDLAKSTFLPAASIVAK